MNRIKNIGDLLYHAADGFIQDDAERHGAALAFYALFTVGPLLVIAIAAAGELFGEQAIRNEVSRQLQTLLSPEAASLVERMVAAAAAPGSGLRATAVGLVALLFGATRGFAQLQASLNAVWGVRRRPSPPVRALQMMLWKRLLSFIAVLIFGASLAASLVSSTLLGVFSEIIGRWLTIDTSILNALDLGIDFALFVGFLALIYKMLPDARVRWQDVFVGAVVTSMLMVFGQFVFSLYVSHTAVTSGYGAAGSLIAFVLLAYFSALAFLFGAEFTEVWAERYGHGIEPSPHAVRETML